MAAREFLPADEGLDEFATGLAYALSFGELFHFPAFSFPAVSEADQLL